MSKNTKMNLKTICHCEEHSATKQSHQIATPYGLAMTSQYGRSMVEMLGVLAIIGVLSVAGIAGYTSAMRQYKANEIAQAITHIAMEAKSANGGNGITRDFYYSHTKPNGLVGLVVSTGGVISVVLENDLPLCKILENRFGTTTTNSIYVKIPCTNGEMKNLKLQIKDPGF